MENLKQKLYDLKQQQKTLAEKTKGFVEAGDLGDEYQKACNDFDDLQTKVKAIEDQMAREGLLEGGELTGKEFNPAAQKNYTSGVLKGLSHDTVKTFADGVRKSLTEGVGADGGYTVPTDVVGRIYELVTAEDNMLPFITNTPVATNTGSRTYKTRQQLTGFATVAEAAKIPAGQKPTFGQVKYTIAKRAGILPVSVELLEDSDENIAALVINWLVAEVRVTIALKTIATAKAAAEATAVNDLDDVMKILTEGLGSAIRKISTIHTNDSGLHWLLTLKDADERPLLQAKPNHVEQLQLCVGPVVIPIQVWDNSVMPNSDGGKIPMIIGSLKEGIERFDRKQLTVSKLTEATVGDLNLAEQDMVAFKGSIRDDYQVRDAGAFKYCELTPAAG